MGQPLEGVHLTATFLSVGAFGLYTCLLLKTLLHLRKTLVRPIYIFTKLSTLWVLALFATVIQTSTTYDAFVGLRATMTPEEYFLTWFGRWQFVLLVALSYVAGLLGNAFICWRLNTFWRGNSKVLIAPYTLLLALTICIIMTIFYHVKAGGDTEYCHLRDAWQEAAVVLILAVNATVMALMCLRIWRVSRSVITLNSTGHPFYRHVIQVLVESGIIYGIAYLLLATLQGAEQISAKIVLAYLIPQVVGIIPTIIALRIHSAASNSSSTETDQNELPPVSLQRPVFASVPVNSIITTTSITTTTAASATYDKLKTFPADLKMASISDNDVSSSADSKPDEADRSNQTDRYINVDLEMQRTR
ncbi:hypothetical protein FRC02_003855 [Tulasnella sp. 418]|nr:hypothetical protein FRC02_003855 [Tulasnella sp. 418]